MFLIAKRGVDEGWPTDKPGDREIVAPIVAERQTTLDARIFEEESTAWASAQLNREELRNFGRSYSLDEARRHDQEVNGRFLELRTEAPVTVCRAILPNGKQCLRKVVGQPGRKCYEHRSPSDEIGNQ
jgi:hypothetical protein